MSAPHRGHVPVLLLGRYRMLKRAADGALDAARELGQIGADSTAADCRRGADMLRQEAHRLRVLLLDASDARATGDTAGPSQPSV